MRILYSAEEIAAATARLAEAINRDYAGQRLHVIGVLKGCFVFLADLVRKIRVPCSVDFVRLSSYGAGTQRSGQVRELLAPGDAVAGRHVMVVEEIIDTGATLLKLLHDLERLGPASLRVCALVDKTGRREARVPVHYRGFTLERGFLVGYGLDFDEKHRNLPAIHVFDELS